MVNFTSKEEVNTSQSEVSRSTKKEGVWGERSSPHFITFGGGLANYCETHGQFVNYREATLRLLDQATSLNLFDQLTAYNDSELRLDPEFWAQHGTIVETQQRGCGYWLWKPYLIMKKLQQMNPNEILLYCDAGCEIDVQNRVQIEHVINQTRKDMIMGSVVREEWGPELHWCKADLVTFLGIRFDDPMLQTQQRQTTAICFKNCPIVRQLVTEWYQVMCHYNLVDDTPSQTPNHPSFIEHRHDQSIFSLLTKKYGIFSQQYLSNNDYWGAIYLYRTRNGMSRITRRAKPPVSPP